jgi:hypothetical protein
VNQTEAEWSFSLGFSCSPVSGRCFGGAVGLMSPGSLQSQTAQVPKADSKTIYNYCRAFSLPSAEPFGF